MEIKEPTRRSTATRHAARQRRVSLENNMWRYLIVSILIIFSASTVLAQDYVRIKYMPGYPRPGDSVETTNIEITRSYLGQSETEIDRYFAAISKILSEDKINTDWERIVVDAPSVQIEISIATKKISLAASYSNKGIYSAPGTDERYGKAMQNILKLTFKRLNEKVPLK